MENDKQINQTSRAMKAMAHPLRLRIVSVLGSREVNVQDLVAQVGTSQSNISQHLAIMRETGVLRTRKDCNRVYYRIADLHILEVLKLMQEIFSGMSGDTESFNSRHKNSELEFLAADILSM